MAYTNEQIQQIVDWFFTEGTRQYIGARYVPVFADPIEHSSARTYEPLTIVQYQGNSYTSKQYVPTGIAVTDERYWALTGNYNAQVELYRAELAGYVEEVTQVSEDMADLNESVNTRLADVCSEYMIVIGDSWCDESDATFPTGGNLFTHLNNRPLYIMKNYARGGAGFFAGTNSNKAFINQLNNAIADTSYPHDQVKKILVVGCINDILQGNDNVGAYASKMNAIINAATAEFKNAVIQFIFLNSYSSKSAEEATWSFVSRTYYDAFVRWANNEQDRNRVNAINLSHLVYRKYYQNDNLHLTSDGYRAVAKKINKFLINGNKPLAKIVCTDTHSNYIIEYDSEKLTMNGFVDLSPSYLETLETVAGGYMVPSTVYNRIIYGEWKDLTNYWLKDSLQESLYNNKLYICGANPNVWLVSNESGQVRSQFVSPLRCWGSSINPNDQDGFYLSTDNGTTNPSWPEGSKGFFDIAIRKLANYYD